MPAQINLDVEYLLDEAIEILRFAKMDHGERLDGHLAKARKKLELAAYASFGKKMGVPEVKCPFCSWEGPEDELYTHASMGIEKS